MLCFSLFLGASLLCRGRSRLCCTLRLLSCDAEVMVERGSVPINVGVDVFFDFPTPR